MAQAGKMKLDLDAINADERYYAVFKLVSVDPFVARICIFYKLDCWEYSAKQILQMLKSDIGTTLDRRRRCGTCKHFNKATLAHTTYFGGELRRCKDEHRTLFVFNADTFRDLINILKPTLLSYFL